LLRRSAAQRAEDVARVLALLRPSYTMTANSDTVVAQRKPFSWQMLIQTIRDSLRNPIPAEEIGACLDILAQKDVAGDWIDVITIGGLKSVVLMSARDISPKEIGVKVSKMQFWMPIFICVGGYSTFCIQRRLGFLHSKRACMFIAWCIYISTWISTPYRSNDIVNLIETFPCPPRSHHGLKREKTIKLN